MRTDERFMGKTVSKPRIKVKEPGEEKRNEP
jgi:hypothetical protein